jgi:hypothetical protein
MHAAALDSPSLSRALALSHLFCDRASGVDLVAGERSGLRWVPLDELESALQADPAALLLLVRFLAQRLRDVQGERAWAERACDSNAGRSRCCPPDRRRAGPMLSPRELTPGRPLATLSPCHTRSTRQWPTCSTTRWA